MEEWELEFEWLKVRHDLKEKFGKKELPDLNAILFLIGINELGNFKEFSKEEKQDLIHIAICKLLTNEGIYAFEGRDTEGWPHYSQKNKIGVNGVKNQEELLKRNIIKYFN